MKKVHTLALTTAILAGAISIFASAPALANDGTYEKHNRFKMAPNKWEADKPTGPKQHLFSQGHSGPAAGSVPKNMLGLNPNFLEKPKPPQLVPASNPMMRPTTSVAARPMPRQEVKGQFNSKFGHPNQPAPLVASQPKQLPDFGSPRALNATPQQPAVQAEEKVAAQLSKPVRARQPVAHSARPAGRLHSSQKVAGNLLSKPTPIARVATPKMYNNGMFEHGGSQVSAKSGHSTKADVYGTIIKSFK